MTLYICNISDYNIVGALFSNLWLEENQTYNLAVYIGHLCENG